MSSNEETELILTTSKNASDDEHRTDQRNVEVDETADRATMLHSTSNTQTLMHLLKCMIGTGILAMPNAFLSSGIWVGLALTLTLGVICLHCMLLLVKSSQTLCRRTRSMCLDYGDVAQLSASTISKSYHCVGIWMRNLVNLFINAMQFGACSVYIVFVASNVKRIVDDYVSSSMDVRLYMLIVTAILIPFCFIKHLTILSIFMGVANVIIVAGLVIIAQYIFRDLPDISTRAYFNSTEYLPMFFGTTLFAFEGIGVVLPLENKMATPEDFGGYFGVLTVGIVISSCLYGVVGFYGYLKLGPAVKGSITLNLPSHNWLYSTATAMFAFAIMLTYGIQYYVTTTILLPSLKRRIPSHWHNIGEYIFRTAFVLFTLLLAALVPQLDLLITLIGSVAATSLTIIFPPIIDIAVQKADSSLTFVTIFKNVLLVLFGIAASISGVVVSLTALINSYPSL